MTIRDIIHTLEKVAHPSLQEAYDNAGLLTGDPRDVCTGVLCTLDCTEAVIDEAVRTGANLVVAHHPIIFRGLKRVTNDTYVGRTVIAAVRAGIAIYAIHTNLDSVIDGVNGRIAQQLGLSGLRILAPKTGTMKKIQTFVPVSHADAVRAAMANAGAGAIRLYDECSFNVNGTGTYRALPGAEPFAGTVNELHREPETRIEMVFSSWLESAVTKALKQSHPYEEVAFDILSNDNADPAIGAGIIGELPAEMNEKAFLALLKDTFADRRAEPTTLIRDRSLNTGPTTLIRDRALNTGPASFIRHSLLTGRSVRTVAVCGGAGSFLVSHALAASVDAFVTADLKYHEFFDADGRMLLADIGHFESEQFTADLLREVLLKKFPTFAVLKSAVSTNPVFYY